MSRYSAFRDTGLGEYASMCCLVHMKTKHLRRRNALVRRFPAADQRCGRQGHFSCRGGLYQSLRLLGQPKEALTTNASSQTLRSTHTNLCIKKGRRPFRVRTAEKIYISPQEILDCVCSSSPLIPSAVNPSHLDFGGSLTASHACEKVF